MILDASRGYPSIPAFLRMIDSKTYFVVRLKSSDFKAEQQALSSDDEDVTIVLSKSRRNHGPEEVGTYQLYEISFDGEVFDNDFLETSGFELYTMELAADGTGWIKIDDESTLTETTGDTMVFTKTDAVPSGGSGASATGIVPLTRDELVDRISFYADSQIGSAPYVDELRALPEAAVRTVPGSSSFGKKRMASGVCGSSIC